MSDAEAAWEDECRHRADATEAAFARSWIEDGIRVVRVPDTEDGRVVELAKWRRGFCVVCDQPCLGDLCGRCEHDGSLMPVAFWNEDA